MSLTKTRGAMAAWIDEALAASPYLAGDKPGLADLSAYMNIWFLGGAVPQTAEALMAGFDRLRAWRERIRGIGHGQRSEMTPAEALEIARTSEPAAYDRHDAADPLGLAPGAAVRVMADDYGRDPIEGRLVAANPERIVVAREDAKLGRLNVHLPRAGYIALAA